MSASWSSVAWGATTTASELQSPLAPLPPLPRAASELTLIQGRHPLAMLLGVPSAYGAVEAPGFNAAMRRSTVSVSALHANHFSGGTSNNEALLLDGETSRVDINMVLPWRHCWSFGLHAPLIAHSPGTFDMAIEQWHGVFGLPNAQRDTVADNRLRFVYQNDSGERAELSEAVYGLGDISVAALFGGHCLGYGGGRNLNLSGLTLRAGIKLPTGSVERFTGSGSTDVFVDGLLPALRLRSRFSLHSMLGLLAVGDSELGPQANALVAYGSNALRFQFSQRWSFNTQLDWNTPMYESELQELGKGAVQLTVGLHGRLRNGLQLQLGFQEDVFIDTAPDFGVFLNLMQRGVKR